MKALGLDATPTTAAEDATDADLDSTTIVDNITVGQARIMTGDIGVEAWQKKATRKVNIVRNKFGGDVRITTGNMGRAGPFRQSSLKYAASQSQS
jgi:hypothetical protein